MTADAVRMKSHARAVSGIASRGTAAPIARKIFDAYLLEDKAPVVDLPVLGKAL